MRIESKVFSTVLKYKKAIIVLLVLAVLAVCLFLTETYRFTNFCATISTNYFSTLEMLVGSIASWTNLQFLPEKNISSVMPGIEQPGVMGCLSIFRFYIFAFLLIYIFPVKRNYNFLFFLGATLFLLILTVVKLLLEFTIDKETQIFSYYFSIDLVNICFNMAIYCLIFYKIRNHNFINTQYLKFDTIVRRQFQFSLQTLILILLLIRPVSGFVDSVIFNQESHFVQKLTQYILWESTMLLKLFQFSPALHGNSIYLGNCWVYLGSACLGIKLMMLYSLVIFSIRSCWVNRALYSFLGVLLILWLNAIRIVIFLVHLYQNKGNYNMSLNVHDLSNYIFYPAVFLLVLGYLFWFKDVNFRVSKRICR